MAMFWAPMSWDTVCRVTMPSSPAFSRASSRCSLNSFRALASLSAASFRAEDAWEKPDSISSRPFSSWARDSFRSVSSSMPSTIPPGMMLRFSLSRASSIWVMPAFSWARPLVASTYFAFSPSGSSRASMAW